MIVYMNKQLEARHPALHGPSFDLETFESLDSEDILAIYDGHLFAINVRRPYQVAGPVAYDCLNCGLVPLFLNLFIKMEAGLCSRHKIV